MKYENSQGKLHDATYHVTVSRI